MIFIGNETYSHVHLVRVPDGLYHSGGMKFIHCRFKYQIGGVYYILTTDTIHLLSIQTFFHENYKLTNCSCFPFRGWTRGDKSITSLSKTELFFSNVLPRSFLLPTLLWGQGRTAPIRPLTEITFHVFAFT